MHEELERFAALVASAAVRETSAEYRLGWNDGQIAEREACARVCDDIHAKYKWPQDTAEKVASQWCADAIRARGQA